MAEIETVIETTIRDTIKTLSDLSDIARYVLGVLPENQLPEQSYPLCQVVVIPGVEFESSITHWGMQYQGLISFAINQTMYTGGDFAWKNSGNVTIRPASFDKVRRWARAARDELRKDANLSLGDLTVNSETVCYFSIDETAAGAGTVDAFMTGRDNTWQNVSTIQFSVITEKPRE